MIASISAIQRALEPPPPKIAQRRDRWRQHHVEQMRPRVALTPYSVSIRRIAAPYCRVSSENIERPAMSSARFCMAASRSTGWSVCAASTADRLLRTSNDMARQQRQRPRRQRRRDGAALQAPVVARRSAAARRR